LGGSSCVTPPPPVQQNTTSEEIYEATVLVKNSRVTGQSVVAGTFALGFLAALISASSAQGLWQSINQIQLYLLVPLIGAYIHPDVVYFLEGFSYTLMSFTFYDYNKISYVDKALSYFPDTPNNEYFQNIGLEYQNTYRNSIGLFWVLALVLLAHLILILPLYIESRRYGINHWFRIKMRPVMFFFTFTIYIRILLEAYLNFTLSSAKEIREVGINASLLFPVVSVLFIMGFFIIWYFTLSGKFEIEESFFKEFFQGFKEKCMARLYFSGFLLRRVLSIFLVISLHFVLLKWKIYAFVGIHFVV
jgi:hypothetical protein